MTVNQKQELDVGVIALLIPESSSELRFFIEIIYCDVTVWQSKTCKDS